MNIKTTDLDLVGSLEDDDTVIVNADGDTAIVKFSLFKNLMSNSWNDLSQKPFTRVGSDFSVDSNGILSISDKVKHIHNNKDVIDRFTVDADGNLLWNNEKVGSDYTLPVATSETLGGVKVDGTSITINSEGVISSATQGLDFSALTTAMTTGILSGINITADTENERFNFEVTSIPTIAIDSEGYWTVNGTRGENPTKAQGDKGNDGITPHIDSTTNHWFIGETDTGIGATAAIDDTSTDGTDVSWSASKLYSMIGDINTVLASVTGVIE